MYMYLYIYIYICICGVIHIMYRYKTELLVSRTLRKGYSAAISACQRDAQWQQALGLLLGYLK